MRRFVFLTAVALLGLAPPTAWGQAYGDPNSLVDYWYRTYLGREPDPGGAAYWVNELNQGNPPDKVLAALLGTPEFYTRAGSTPEGFMTLLYNDILHRPPNPNELAFWVGRMYTEDRATVADEILTQNPGVWVGAAPPAPPVTPAVPAPPVVIPPRVGAAPAIERLRHQMWERDRAADWTRRHDIHEYRRPGDGFHDHDHHDRGRR